MRPIISLPHATGFVMLLYAVGVLSTPTGGAMGYMTEAIGVSAHFMAVVFVACGLIVFFFNPNPALFAVLTAPILLYSLGSFGYLLSPRGGSLTAFFAHISVWLIANAAITEKARSWTQS